MLSDLFNIDTTDLGGVPSTSDWSGAQNTTIPAVGDVSIPSAVDLSTFNNAVTTLQIPGVPATNSSGIPDSIPASLQNPTAFLNSVTGTLGKAFDTALDIGLGSAVGSLYPTGQQNPAAATTTSATAVPATTNAVILYAGLAIGAGLLLLLIVRGSRK